MKHKKGFTLIELIVVMAVIGVLVLLAMPKFMGYTEKTRLTEMKNNIKQLEDASERYYIDKQEWPRASDEYYTKEELEVFANEIKNRTGYTVDLDPDGKYYPIDYKKLQKYVQEPKDGIHYILQNPVGEVFYLDGLTDKGKTALNSDIEEPEKDPESEIDPKYTENLAKLTNGIPFSSSSWTGTYAFAAFDGYLPYYRSKSDFTAWGTHSTTGWLAFDFYSPKVIQKYAISTYKKYVAPKNWTFEAWDGSKWVVLDTRVGEDWSDAPNTYSSYVKHEFTFKNNKAYSKYRINVTANGGGTAYDVNLSINELELMTAK